jgi:uncharacterized protein YeaO (DUF488 family)
MAQQPSYEECGSTSEGCAAKGFACNYPIPTVIGGHMKIRIKRVYEPRAPEDGQRILVDRLWPRGLTKEKAAVDLWLKDIAPSTELRKLFSHELAKWKEFQLRYREELKGKVDTISTLKAEAKKGPITLLFGAKDEEHNEAVVLRAILER